MTAVQQSLTEQCPKCNPTALSVIKDVMIKDIFLWNNYPYTVERALNIHMAHISILTDPTTKSWKLN